MTSATRSSTSRRWRSASRPTAAGLSGWSGSSRTSFRAPSISRANSGRYDVPVVVGGFHVSGCISMLPELPPDLKEAQALGVTLYAGEGEGRMADLIRDIAAGQAKPVYNYLNDMPGMEAAAIPVLPKEVVGRIVGHHACFDAGRGCPFQCSFCTIINVQGPQVALSQRRRRGSDRARQLRPGHQPLFRHRRQFRPQPQLGIDPRPADRAENQPGHSDQADPSGRHALPQDPGLHREGGAGRLQPGVHRAREHQSAIAPGGEEAAEQDLGIPGHAAGLARAQGDDLGGLHHRLSDRHARIGHARHRHHQEGTAARHPRVFLPDARSPAPRTTRFSTSKGSRWTRT